MKRKTLRQRSTRNTKRSTRSIRRSGGKRTAKQIVRQRRIGDIYAELSKIKAKQAMLLVDRLQGKI
uniref:Uncharacterized protein n=1 Tax=viral metagenome TaxID=1070528 RepID=A0A6C0DE28_9ZZZZ